MSLKDDIADLKYKLQTAEDFGEVWTAFFDVSNTEIFMNRSRPLRKMDSRECEIIKRVLAQMGQHFFGGPGILSNFTLLELQPYHLLHGPFTLHNHFGTVIYFKDIDVGMAAVVKSFQTSGMHFTRFTLMMESKEKPEGFFYNPTSQGGH